MPSTILQPDTLPNLLHSVFGHRDFRPHQRQVCEAAAAGRDVLLVMPTGAGKSLCYQLPALARRSAEGSGTALVISPLIALMDDQAAKLTALGLRVARIHSGLSRDDARQACRDYLDGTLDFLFIAPERMRVPGFPEMLAKRKPTLIAIDEAHCISAWGHDFRPDYRTLGQHLPAMRPSPIIALTATATPTVQRDIARQLDLRDPAIFITGFRRSNLAVEVVELSKPQRPDFALKLLKDPAARPAIVYAQSRKDAEEFAAKLHQHFPTAAYHAGLGPQLRERVQRDFLAGQLDVIVATVAFGMGVDKADIRTVLHVALPGSVESYYQEIGRAGRDGLPSRTVLLHGFADRRLQEFFLEKNYPPVTDLERVARVLPPEFTPIDVLHNALVRQKIAIDRETLDRTLEKLLVAGVADMDIQGDVRLAPNAGDDTPGAPSVTASPSRVGPHHTTPGATPGAPSVTASPSRVGPHHAHPADAAEPTWQSTYAAQIAVRRAQIDAMIAFAESTTCRMAALVRHFGDLTDQHGPCGLCDICNPAGPGSSHAAHQPTPQQRTWLRQILFALAARSTSTGKLFTDLQLKKDNQNAKIDARNDFDALLDALARAGLITLTSDTFRTPDGRDVTYKKAAITHDGRLTGNDATDNQTLDTVWIRGSLSGVKPGNKRSVKKPGAPSVTASPSRVGPHHTTPGKNPGAPSVTASPSRVGPHHTTRRKNPGAPSVTASPSRVGPHPAQSTSAVRENKRPGTPPPPPPLTAAQLALEERLKLWRRDQARAAGLPSFFILSDTVLRNIVLAAPSTTDDLRNVRGLAADKLDRFGQSVLSLCQT